MPSTRVLLITAFMALKLASGDEAPAFKTAPVNGVALHYFSTGNGAPLVLVHGTLDDYRMWDDQIASFAQHYRVINYSRRYSFPNQNNPIASGYSAETDAEDLAALINQLQIGPVHIVAHSYGGYAALFLAVQHPELVRSMVLAEPAAFCWLRDNPLTRPFYDDQITRLRLAASAAFRRGDDDGALRVALEYFEGAGAFERLSDLARKQVRENLSEWRGLVESDEPFPALPQDRVAKIDKHVLLLTGQDTVATFRAVHEELRWLLPAAEQATIPQAKHEIWAENGAACREATLRFLDQQH